MATRPTTSTSMFRSPESALSTASIAPGEVLSEAAFHNMIARERKRSERSQRPFVLLLIDTGRKQPGDKQGRVLLEMVATLQAATRETDVTGWYTEHSVVGVVFTEIVLDNNAVLSTILARIGAVLRDQLDTDQFGRIKFSSFHVFPDDWDEQNPIVRATRPFTRISKSARNRIGCFAPPNA